jgi:aminoglycoside phosphotransferase family enzyme/predicted kinase
LRGLLRPEAYPHPVAELQLIETHISWVLLTGEYAYKLKRPVHYPFVDLRSPRRRAFLCAEEVRLNRRFAPRLYLGVCKIVAANGRARVSERGRAIENAVRMRQFNLEDALDRLIESNRAEAAELETFGRDLASIHAGLPRAPGSRRWGTVEAVRAQLNANFTECRQFAMPHGTAGMVDALAAPFDAILGELEPQIAARRRQVRECHGDLHTRNLVRDQGRLIAFDCIEFEPSFRWIDVADEVSFLWMDLRSKRRADLALAFLSGYLAQSGDFELCRLLPLYGVHRALVRAKVAALEAHGALQPQIRAAALVQHRACLDCARALLSPARPLLVLMSGLSGSGKTWLARQLAPPIEALHLRSDVERKRIAGLAPTADSHSVPGGGLYSAGSSRHVYEHLAHCADAALAGGLNVIVDATFTQRAERQRFRELATRRGCEIVLVRCRAPMPLLRARIAERRGQAADPSEADSAVLDWQTNHEEPIEPGEGFRIIEADTARETVLSEVHAALGRVPGKS